LQEKPARLEMPQRDSLYESTAAEHHGKSTKGGCQEIVSGLI
jgi:hypothetical protein